VPLRRTPSAAGALPTGGFAWKWSATRSPRPVAGASIAGRERSSFSGRCAKESDITLLPASRGPGALVLAGLRTPADADTYSGRRVPAFGTRDVMLSGGGGGLEEVRSESEGGLIVR
jgi:hypothetical protein